MTLLELWAHTPLAESLGYALAHSLWEGLLIAVVLALALCLLRSSPARYGVACAAMLLMLASFAVTVARLWPQPIELSKAPHAIALRAAPASLSLTPSELSQPSAGLAVLLPWIALLWAAGVLFFHVRALGGWMAARRLRSSGVCSAPVHWQYRLNALAAQLRVSRPAMLLESCLAEVPVVIGYARPVILMPVGLLAGLPLAQVEAILLHELAHIRRQDYLVNLMQTFVEGLLFYHPAVWWISSVIRAERENCCDDLVVAATGDARQYAAALTALEQNRWAAHELAMAATGGSLVKRIRRLLQQPERSRAVWTPAISAGFLLIGAGLALASWQAPQTQPAPTVLAPSAAPQAAPVAVAQPPVAPVVRARKPAPAVLAQVQTVTPSVEQQLKDQLDRELANRTKNTPPYKKWLNEDVAYIIADQEREAFKALATDPEREQFIDEFWLRRDPTPGTPQNEFKQEHYRRIAYANEHFASQVPGWKTDRGRIYITYGPPDEIEDHATGGFYARPPEEGGGTTNTFPFQQWRYKWIAGVGQNIIIEFVDPTYTKEFRMTTDPSEKDALRFVHQPQSAPVPVQAQVKTPGGRGQSASASAPSATSTPNIFVSVGEGPKVTVAITSGSRNTGMNIALPSGSGKYDVIGRITDANNKTAANLRDVTSAGQLNYPAAFSLAPGTYKLTVLVRDQASGAMQTSTVSFYVN